MPQMHGLPLGGGGRRQVGSQLREFFLVEIEGLVDIVSDDPQLFVEIGQALGYAAQRACRALGLGHGQRLVDEKFGNQRVAKKNRIVVALCRSEEHTPELQSLQRISYAIFCLKKNKPQIT